MTPQQIPNDDVTYDLDDVFFVGALVTFLIGGIGVLFYLEPFVVGAVLGGFAAFILVSFIVGYLVLLFPSTVRGWVE